jgi:hypothetical protein
MAALPGRFKTSKKLGEFGPSTGLRLLTETAKIHAGGKSRFSRPPAHRLYPHA